MRCTLVILALLAATANGLHAQTATGIPPFSSTAGGPETINLGNLNVNLVVPIFNKPGRGLSFNYALTMDSSVWYPSSSSGNLSWTPVFDWGWQSSYSANTGYVTYSQTTSYCPHGSITDDSNYVYHDPWGIAHSFTGYTLQVVGTCTGVSNVPSFSSQANDNSGLTMNATYGSASVVTPGGALLQPPSNPNGNSPSSTLAQDSNGNQITENSSGVLTDTLGVTALTISGSAPNPVTFTYTDSTPTARTVTLYYKQYTVQTYFGCGGIHEYGPTTNYLVDHIQYPDGSTYSFQYEATPNGSGNVTGRPWKITLPPGGTLVYTYPGSNNGITCSDGSASALTRQTPDGTTTYARTDVSGSEWTTLITDPFGDQTTIWFQNYNNNFYETKRQINQNNGGTQTTLRTIYTCYNGAVPDCSGSGISGGITEVSVTTALESNQQLRTNTFYSASGLPTETDEYDVGSGSPGSLLRSTLISYASLGNGIVDRVGSITIQNGGGTKIAQTNYSYDQGTPSPSGAPQHVAISGSRGNLTTISQWLNTTGGSLNTTLAYDDAGNVTSSIDPGSHTTTFQYANSDAFVSQVTMPATSVPQLLKASYDSNTGLLNSTTDQNGQTTNYSYDCMLRQVKVVFPDGGEADMGYSATPNSSAPPCTFATPPWVETKQKKDATNWLDQITSLDALGRVVRTQLASDPEGADSVDATYDAIGRIHSVSNPYRTTAEATYGLTTYFYDALSRPIQVTDPDGNIGTASYGGNCATVADEALRARQVCTDGLGRTAQVTEANPLNGSLMLGALSTFYTYSGFVVSINQVGDRSQSARVRTSTTDSLGRLVSTFNPESGTTNYGYSADPTCNPDGFLRTKTDARNITTTYCYDKLHRVSQRSYSDGTPTAYFLYDIDPGWGVSATNPVGRMTEAYTDSSTSGEVFGYDATGRVVMNSQCTPFNCGSGAWPISYAYDLAGNQNSYSTGAGITFSQSFDSASHLTQISSNYVDGQHPATLTTVDPSIGYFATGAIRKMSLGNGLTETAAYNVRLQPCRMNVNASSSGLGGCNDPLPNQTLQDFSYGFNFGSTNNGNLASLAGLGVQNFSRSYSYDWLNRLQAVSAPGEVCEGLEWAYDAWGNRTQQNGTAGSCLGWQAAVNAQNQLVGPPYQYDAAGNLTYDGVHQYSYDAENRIVAIDGGSTALYIYDAMGRRVRKSGPGVSSTTDYIYDLSGNVVSEWISGGTFTGWNALYAYLNGQQLVQYRNNTTYFVHKDHLGSAHLVTTVGGGVYESDDYLPFGEHLTASTNPGVLSSGFEVPSTLVGNPGFEQITSTTVAVQSPGFEGNSSQGWVLGFWGNTSFVSNSQARSGGYSLAQTGSIEGGSFQDVSGLTPGQSYQVSVWVCADAGTTAQMMLWLHDTAGNNTLQTALLTPGQSWQLVTLTYVADSTGAVRIHLYYHVGAGTIYYDDVQVVQQSAQSWVMGFWGATSYVSGTSSRSGGHSLAQSGSTQGGSYQDVGGLVAGQSYQISVWVRSDAGTTAQAMLWVHDTTGANSSQTTAITPGQSWQQVALNYVADATGAVRIHLFYCTPGAGTIYFDDVQVVQDSSQGWTLGYWGAISVITSTQAHSGGFSLAQSGSIEGGSYQDVSGLVPNQSYQVSVWVRADAGTTSQMYLWVHDTTGSNSSHTAAITPGQNWQQVVINYIADSTGQVRTHLHYLPGAGTIYYDDVQIASQSAPGDVVTHKFTGDEHDAESNLEHTQFRQLSSVQGRWFSPDPAGMAAGDLTNPQSLNLYAYVNNNPMNAVDPLGLDPGDQDAGDSLPSDCYFNPTVCAINGGLGYSYCVFVGLCSPDGTSTNSGGGGSPTTPPATEPNVNPGGKPPLSGETLGIPNSVHIQIPSILQTLGLVPIDPACEYMPCSFADGNQPSTKYQCDFFSGVCFHTYYDPYPIRLFGTHWCGPGGAGPTLGPLDAACKEHDQCYDTHHLTWQMNFKLSLRHQQAVDLAACNQKLCDTAAANDSEVGATRVRMFFTIVPPTGSQCE